MDNKTTYIDYREKLREIFEEIYKVSNEQITQGLAFYDWTQEIEKEYRTYTGILRKDLINDKLIYEFALIKYKK